MARGSGAPASGWAGSVVAGFVTPGLVLRPLRTAGGSAGAALSVPFASDPSEADGLRTVVPGSKTSR